MKFINTFILFCCTFLITACDGSNHKHSAEIWERNVSEHWQQCECGEAFNIGEYTLEKDECSVCNSQIFTYDGGADIYNYNEKGDLEKISCYDGDGNIISESITEIEYDESGNKIKETTYDNGELSFVAEFALTDDKKTYQKSFTSFMLNGEKGVYEYNENGEITVIRNINSDGTVIYEEIYEYGTDSNGNQYNSKITQSNYEYGTVTVIEMTENGDITLSSEQDLEGNVIHEDRYDRKYDENGNKIEEKYYVNGVLVYEVLEFAYSEDGNRNFPKKEIEYTEDGLTKVYDYNDNGELILEKHYDENGDVVYYYVCEYEYNENDVMLSKKTYENGSLLTEEYFASTEEGYTYTESETFYYPELNVAYKSIYNEFGDQISRIVYDANGNITQEDVFEIEYDENGNTANERHYTDGVLTYEALNYVTESDEFSYIRYPAIIIRYYEDGTKEITQNGKYGLIVKETLYAADDSVETETVYEYEFFESGDIKSRKLITNNAISKEEFHEMNDGGWSSYLNKEINYFEDGSKIITEYDEESNILFIKTYDAEGNEIESDIE